MGSCASFHLRRAPAPAASIVADIPSPVKDIAVNGGGGGGVLKSQWSSSQSNFSVRDYGSKDDVFFESKAWLDSDCEDDFFSVNGDFTPSRGNTPVHHSFMGTPQVRKTSSMTTEKEKAPASIPEPSPDTTKKKKKKLAELFRDSFGSSQEAPFAAAAYGDESKSSPTKTNLETPKPLSTTILDILPSSQQGTRYISGANSPCNSERLPDVPDQEQKLDRPVQQRCLPSLMSCRISVDRKKKMPPAIPVHD